MRAIWTWCKWPARCARWATRASAAIPPTSARRPYGRTAANRRAQVCGSPAHIDQAIVEPIPIILHATCHEPGTGRAPIVRQKHPSDHDAQSLGDPRAKYGVGTTATVSANPPTWPLVKPVDRDVSAYTVKQHVFRPRFLSSQTDSLADVQDWDLEYVLDTVAADVADVWSAAR